MKNNDTNDTNDTSETQIVPRRTYLLEAAPMWHDDAKVELIKQTFCIPNNLTVLEAQTFVEIGQRTGLNPFLRELWAVKYDTTRPASIFVGRDGYRKSAQAHPDYDGHLAIAVYENDRFKIENGNPAYDSAKFSERGRLSGAYCSVRRKSISRDFFVFVDFAEYTTGKSLWKSKPATMIKKVAESQALRMAFQELFAGTYGEDENWHKQEDENKPAPVASPAVKFLTKNNIQISEALHHMRNSESIHDLRVLFANYVQEFQTNPTLVTELIAAKDKRKIELEKNEIKGDMYAQSV